MAINFPAAPLEGDTYTYLGKTWAYDGTATKWVPNDDLAGFQAQLDTKLGAADLSSYNGNVDITGSLTTNLLEVQGGITEESVTIVSSGGAATIYLSVGTNFVHDLTESVTYTFSNAAASGKSSSFSLKVIQDVTARTITWPTSVDWAAATAPVLTATNSGVDVFVFMTHDGGTTWYGFTAGQGMG